MGIKSSNQITFTEYKKIVEIKEWYLATNQDSNVTTANEGWTNEIQTIDESKPYLWNYEEVVYSMGDPDVSEPMVIGFYSKGVDGKSIQDIKNYYQITTDTEVPEEWLDAVPMLDPVNKYLWNYEEILYTNGEESTKTTPAIIGVYGDSDVEAVDFQIYSTDGFEFNESLLEIELKTVAFKNGAPIEEDITYQWKWWNAGSAQEDKYEEIADATESILTVKNTDNHAFTSLKCEMTHAGKVYEDYVSLTSETVIYGAVVKFFDGSNIFNAEDPYLVAYVELYKNNKLMETISSTIYSLGTISGSTITTTLTGSFTNGERVYFIYKNADNLYQAALGEYQSGTWNVAEDATEYIYENTLYPGVKSNVLVISKESINKSQNIDFTIYKDGDKVAATNAIVIDINDPIISSSIPQNPTYGQLWLDTSTTPYALKIFTQNEDVGEWVYFSQQNGKTVYTSKPSEYSIGDLWILATGEVCGDFGPGSMLKATTTVISADDFSDSHWIDADEEKTTMQNNIKQYFSFDPDMGLRIGQTDNKFYTNISSTRMSFCENPNITTETEENIDPNEVVYISNKSAGIKNMIVEENATFNCNTTFNKDVYFGDFIWQVESNGSLSFAIVN